MHKCHLPVQNVGFYTSFRKVLFMYSTKGPSSLLHRLPCSRPDLHLHSLFFFLAYPLSTSIKRQNIKGQKLRCSVTQLDCSEMTSKVPIIATTSSGPWQLDNGSMLDWGHHPMSKDGTFSCWTWLLFLGIIARRRIFLRIPSLFLYYAYVIRWCHHIFSIEEGLLSRSCTMRLVDFSNQVMERLKPILKEAPKTTFPEPIQNHGVLFRNKADIYVRQDGIEIIPPAILSGNIPNFPPPFLLSSPLLPFPIYILFP